MFAPVLCQRRHLIGCKLATAPRLSEGERFRPRIAPHVIGRVHIKKIMAVELFARPLVRENDDGKSPEHKQQIPEPSSDFSWVRAAEFPNCLRQKYQRPDCDCR